MKFKLERVARRWETLVTGSRQRDPRTGRLNDTAWYCERGGGGGGGGDAAAVGRPCEVHVSLSSDAPGGARRRSHEESRSAATLCLLDDAGAGGVHIAASPGGRKVCCWRGFLGAATSVRFDESTGSVHTCQGRAEAQNSCRDFPRARHFSSSPFVEVFIGLFLAAVADTLWLVVPARKAFGWGKNGGCLIKRIFNLLFVAFISLV